MSTAGDRVTQALNVAAALHELVAADDQGGRWEPTLAAVEDDLRAADDTGPAEALRSAHDRYGSILGGMGSFNDYWIPGRDERLDELRTRLHELLQLDAGVLDGAGPDPKSRTCPVCGYPDLAEPPRSPTGGASYEICPSCGFQFGVTDDDDGISYDEWRRRWVAEGMPWSSSQSEPAGWDPAEQLARVTG